MRSRTFKLDSPKAHRLKLISGLVGGIGMSPLLFWGLSAMKGTHNALSRWGEQWWPVGLIVMIIGIGVGIYVSYGYYSTLTLTEQPNLGLQVHIADPGDATSANGTWKWYAYYVVIHGKYGMTKKECHLVLFNKDKAFCEFQQDLGSFTEQPAPAFVGLNGTVGLPVATYRTRNINEILSVVASAHGSTQVVVNRKDMQERPEASVLQGEPVTHSKETKAGAPEYGDPDYDL